MQFCAQNLERGQKVPPLQYKLSDPFIDSDFPPANRSIGRAQPCPGASEIEELQWMRYCNISNSGCEQSLLGDLLSQLHAVNRPGLYFLESLWILSHRPHLIERLFYQLKTNQAGWY